MSFEKKEQSTKAEFKKGMQKQICLTLGPVHSKNSSNTQSKLVRHFALEERGEPKIYTLSYPRQKSRKVVLHLRLSSVESIVCRRLGGRRLPARPLGAR
jgi:hypothetical protein